MKSKKLCAVSWMGGKQYMVKELLKWIPKHKVYVEVFGGGGALLLNKPKSELEVYNDLDSNVVNFFRVLRDEEKCQRLCELVELTPYSREEYYHCLNNYDNCVDDVEQVYQWFVAQEMAFSGKFNAGWCHSVRFGRCDTCKRWCGKPNVLRSVAKRLKQVQIDNRDFKRILQVYDSEDTCFYLDPPYVSIQEYYQYKMTRYDHMALVQILLGLKGMSMLSGYENRLYKPLEQVGWYRHDFKAACYSQKAKTEKGEIKDVRIESLWLSPNLLKNRGLSRYL